MCTTEPCDCPSEVPLTLVAKPRTGPVIRSLLASLTVEAQHILGASAPDDDEIDYDKRISLNHGYRPHRQLMFCH